MKSANTNVLVGLWTLMLMSSVFSNSHHDVQNYKIPNGNGHFSLFKTIFTGPPACSRFFKLFLMSFDIQKQQFHNLDAMLN